MTGLRVDLVLGSSRGHLYQEAVQQVRVIDLHGTPKSMPEVPGTHYAAIVAALPGLIRYMKSEAPDVVLAVKDHANLAALWARHLAGSSTRTVLTVHGLLSNRTPSPTTLGLRLLPRLVRRFYRRADAVVAVSAAVAQDLALVTGIPRDHIHVIYNPVITEDLIRMSTEATDHPWLADRRVPVLASAGRLSREKDFPTLIASFALVRERLPAKLIILGDGRERSRLQRLISTLRLEEDVVIQGFVSNPYPFISRAAGVVLTSRSEGLPTVLIEALGLGTPVVATDVGGVREILKDEQWGRIVPVGDKRAIAGALHDLLVSKRRITQTEELDAWLDRFTVRRATDEYLKVLGTR